MSLDDLKLALGNLSQALREVQDCLDLAKYQPDDLSQAWQALDETERDLQETRGYLMVCEIPDAWKLPSPPDEGGAMSPRADFQPLSENDPARHVGEDSGSSRIPDFGNGGGWGDGGGHGFGYDFGVGDGCGYGCGEGTGWGTGWGSERAPDVAAR